MGITKEQREIKAQKLRELQTEKNMQDLLNNKWLQKKHIKHSTIQVAHFESLVSQSTTGYNCRVCYESGSRYSIHNKRLGKGKWQDDTGIRLCGTCIDKIREVFPAKLDYCK